MMYSLNIDEVIGAEAVLENHIAKWCGLVMKSYSDLIWRMVLVV